MAAIPWWAWLGIGGFVTITSTELGGKLLLFAWIGMLFLVIGVAKAVYIFVLRDRGTTVDQLQQQVHTSPRQQTFFCPRCRSSYSANDYFCRLCGVKLR